MLKLSIQLFAVPFRKVSKTRGRMRRTHYKIEANGTIECPNCKAAVRPHRICPECGFYKGKEVVAVKKEVKETPKKEVKKTPKKSVKKATKKETKKEA